MPLVARFLAVLRHLLFRASRGGRSRSRHRLRIDRLLRTRPASEVVAALTLGDLDRLRR